MTITHPFTEEEMIQAAAEWGCNCGPAALAFVLQRPLADVRHAIPDFDRKRYTSPSMMRAAIAKLGAEIKAAADPVLTSDMFSARIALVRIQWTGPWTAPGANPRWAYRQTHWIATWLEAGCPTVFDCNGGVRTFPSWSSMIVPLIVSDIPRANGEWFPTHIWRLERVA